MLHFGQQQTGSVRWNASFQGALPSASADKASSMRSAENNLLEPSSAAKNRTSLETSSRAITSNAFLQQVHRLRCSWIIRWISFRFHVLPLRITFLSQKKGNRFMVLGFQLVYSAECRKETFLSPTAYKYLLNFIREVDKSSLCRVYELRSEVVMRRLICKLRGREMFNDCDNSTVFNCPLGTIQ